MTESEAHRSQLPLEIDRIQSSRSAVGETRLRLSGRWLQARRAPVGEEALLVVHVEGRRHRFAPDRDGGPDVDAEPGRWSASFTVPSWAEPRQEGQAALWLGNAVIPVPPLHGAIATVRAEDQSGDRAPVPIPDPTEPSRAGPLAELLLKDTVAALQTELEQRAAEVAQTRAALAAAHSELDARGDRYSKLEALLAELRGELDGLRAAVEKQRRELEQQSAAAVELRERLSAAEASAELRAAETVALRAELTAANVSREAVVSEAAGLRSELERVGSELAVTHERIDSEAAELGEASRLLADAKALAAELGTSGAPGARS